MHRANDRDMLHTFRGHMLLATNSNLEAPVRESDKHSAPLAAINYGAVTGGVRFL